MPDKPVSRVLPYGKQHITEEDVAAVAAALRGDLLTQGPIVPAFEAAFAQYIGAQYGVAVANGTAALHLCTLALGCAGKKVLVTPLTFAASVNCVCYVGGIPDFVDIDPQTLLMDVGLARKKLEAAPTGTYAGIIPVDFAGNPVHIEAVRELADDFGLWIVEDACHAPGGFFADSGGARQRCGNGAFAELAIFSFHPVKHIAAGEGGMITTNDQALYKRLLALRNHGMTRDANTFALSPGDLAQGGWYYEIQELGYNYRLTDIHAALGLSQLSRAGAGLARRKQLAAQYDAAFAGTPVAPAPTSDGHAYHLYVIQVPGSADARKTLYDHLRTKGIFTQIHYIPVHLLPFYRGLGWQKGDCPHAETYYEHCLSIPLYPTLTDEEQSYVVNAILAAVNR